MSVKKDPRPAVMFGGTRISFAFRNFLKWSSVGSHLFWRGMRRSSGITRQNKPKVWRAFNEEDLQRVKSLTFDAARLRYGCSPPGIGFSSVKMPVRPEGPKVPVQKLAPSLVEFLEASLHGHQDDGPKGEAFDVLQNALGKLTSPSNEAGLTIEVMLMLANLRKDSSSENGCSEEDINVEIVKNFFLNLTRGSCVLNEGHRQALKAIKAVSNRILLPEDVGWEGLALGNKDPWFGELDMLIIPPSTRTEDPPVAVLFEKTDEDNEVDWLDYKEKGDSIAWTIPDGSYPSERPVERDCFPNFSLYEGCRYSRAFATAVTFSYVYCYGWPSKTQSAPSFLPTIQVSIIGYRIFVYDCIQDVMLAASLVWTRGSLIYLWAFLHFHLFFPPSLNEIQVDNICKFGYEGKPGFYSKRSELCFGHSMMSKMFSEDVLEEGFFQDY